MRELLEFLERAQVETRLQMANCVRVRPQSHCRQNPVEVGKGSSQEGTVDGERRVESEEKRVEREGVRPEDGEWGM